MKKTAIILLLPFMFGCVTLQEPCIERPIYKPYTFDKPSRPKMVAANIGELTDPGDVGRMIQSDFINLMEYAEKLENIINAIPNNVGVPE